MIDGAEMTATSSGNGQSVNIQLSDSFKLRWTHYGLIVLCVALSIYAAVTAWHCTQDVSSLKTEARLWQYWGERAEVAAEKQGLKLPPIPTKQ